VSERNAYPHGVPCWVDTLQSDPDAALAFYGAVFGWQFEEPGEMPGVPPGRYFVGRLRGRDVAGIGSLPADGQAPASSFTMYVRVDSADDAAREARAAGGTVVLEPFDAPPAGRMAVIADPTGAQLCVWQAGAREGAQLVNEAGAWSMSQLHTPDPEAAAAFYGAVFGWTTEAFGPATLFRRPGYVGGEPAQPVSREVVAAMAPAEAGETPRWSADFWVEDVDATVATAERLGGRTIAPPAASPTGKTAVLADPSGVSFSVSSVPGPARAAA
jgi:uncharacterized protein